MFTLWHCSCRLGCHHPILVGSSVITGLPVYQSPQFEVKALSLAPIVTTMDLRARRPGTHDTARSSVACHSCNSITSSPSNQSPVSLNPYLR